MRLVIRPKVIFAEKLTHLQALHVLDTVKHLYGKQFSGYFYKKISQSGPQGRDGQLT